MPSQIDMEAYVPQPSGAQGPRVPLKHPETMYISQSTAIDRLYADTTLIVLLLNLHFIPVYILGTAKCFMSIADYKRC